MNTRLTQPPQETLFEGLRMTFREAIDEALASLRAYGERYRHWCVAYSGGKDSSATVSLVVWAIRNGLVPAPEVLHVLYADTRQELTPLSETAHRLIADLRLDGINARAVLPGLDHRFYVYMLGRGVPPPSNTFRWCTPKLKIDPMNAEMARVHQQAGEKFLQITGVRLGESARRDAKIAVSCSKDSGECGQGWFQAKPSTHAADTLAPLLSWRQCFVWDWLYFAHSGKYMKSVIGLDVPGHGFDYLADIAVAYGNDDGRTGCIGCALASRDVALEHIVTEPGWEHLSPLLEIKPMLREMKKSKHRVRKATPERKKDGDFAKNGQRMGPLTMAARQYFLDKLLDIQQRAGVDLVNAEEEARIRELWQEGVWPEGWGTDNDVPADVLLDKITVIGADEIVTQPVLLGD